MKTQDRQRNQTQDRPGNPQPEGPGNKPIQGPNNGEWRDKQWQDDLIDDRELILGLRYVAERVALLHDIGVWKTMMPEGTMIHHHIRQFEKLCTWTFDQLELEDGLFRRRPEEWANIDESIFNSLLTSVLAGKWIHLRNAAEQRVPGSPYLGALQELDGFASDCYQRLRTILQTTGKVKGISGSPPLVYLGPVARLFLFDEQAPCLISVPFAAAQDQNTLGKALSRQTIPHEVGHAIFEQLPGFIEELRFKTKTKLDAPKKPKQALIRSTVLNWLEEMVADMAGTALAGPTFAYSAGWLTIMPDQLIGLTDGYHPLPLLRTYVHGWVLEQLDPEAAINFNSELKKVTQDYFKRPFESLPAVTKVTMGEVKEELLTVVRGVWESPLETIGGATLAEVFQKVYQMKVPPILPDTAPAWGMVCRQDGQDDEVLFRLVGPNTTTSPLPKPPLFFDLVCCNLRIQFCCSQTVM